MALDNYNILKAMMWKPVDGYEDKYLLSDHGRIKSSISGKYLKPAIDRYGYLYFGLTKNSITKKFKVHQLVIQHFGPDRPSAAYEVNHKDGVKTNNHISNLEWVTVSENRQHAYDTGLQARGELHTNAKLSDAEVIAIRELWNEGELTQKEIGAAFGVHQTTISEIVLNKKRTTNAIR